VPTERVENVVPSSTESQFPYLWFAPLLSALWMPMDVDPGAQEMGIPSCNGDPREHNWDTPPPTRSWCTIRPTPHHALRFAPPPPPLSGESRRPRYCLQVKHMDKQIHPTETIQAFDQLICL